MLEKALEGLCQLLRVAVGCLVGALIVQVTTQVDAYACAQAIDLSHTYKAKASKPVMA